MDENKLHSQARLAVAAPIKSCVGYFPLTPLVLRGFLLLRKKTSTSNPFTDIIGLDPFFKAWKIMVWIDVGELQ